MLNVKYNLSFEIWTVKKMKPSLFIWIKNFFYLWLFLNEFSNLRQFFKIYGKFRDETRLKIILILLFTEWHSGAVQISGKDPKNRFKSPGGSQQQQQTAKRLCAKSVHQQHKSRIFGTFPENWTAPECHPVKKRVRIIWT